MALCVIRSVVARASGGRSCGDCATAKPIEYARLSMSLAPAKFEGKLPRREFGSTCVYREPHPVC
jgi:hypothetical protein